MVLFSMFGVGFDEVGLRVRSVYMYDLFRDLSVWLWIRGRFRYRGRFGYSYLVGSMEEVVLCVYYNFVFFVVYSVSG